MAFLASASAFSSSARLLVSASKSCDLAMQSWCSVPLVSMSSASSLEVTSRSPSAVDLVSPCEASAFFVAARSFSAYLISSRSDWAIISKACLLDISLVRASSSCSLALSRRFSSASMMPPPWPLYTAAAGAPTSSLSSSSLLSPFCTSAVSFAASCEPIMEASTMALRACIRPLAFWTCTIAAPCFFISRSRMPMARSMVLMMSMDSFSATAKSATSFSRMLVAAFRSASLVPMLAASSSILADAADASAVELSIVAFSSSTSALPVLISKPTFRERSSHHSEYSAKVFCAASPSLTILPCRSERSCRAFCTGLCAAASWANATSSSAVAVLVFIARGVRAGENAGRGAG
mmetsp:Transcript_72749/g.187704  ORF Transcript_72749/g.187704 Transcript_72749/m.187704 type:complete len:351 (-) Transcript_72749:16-1068(-)